MVNTTPDLRSYDADLLERRIAVNQSAQTIDFNRWIFQGIRFPPESHILELCCGTGTQTLEFLRRLDGGGRYVGVDKSRKALDVIRKKVSPELGRRMTLLCSEMDLIGPALEAAGLEDLKFDLIFCSYGLYYSSDVPRLLSEMEGLLGMDGSIVIVGPYGPNNETLFRMLNEAGVQIPEYVRFTSQRFMHDVVIPWGTLHFPCLSIRTMANPIVWTSPDQVLEYWKNSTFFDPGKIQAVAERLREFFAGEPSFINKKYVMMVVMKHE
jgi:ubiquinone/menaquinone biosynthesis C-methylase UbiE